MSLVFATLSALAATSLALLEAKIPATDAPPSTPGFVLQVEMLERKPARASLLPDTGNPLPPRSAAAGAQASAPRPDGKPVQRPDAAPYAKF